MACGAIGDFTESSVVDWTWTHPQSGVEYVCEYPFRRLDREADSRGIYAFEGMVGSDEEQPIGVKK